VWRKTVADLETPVAAFLKLAHGQPNSFLLESVEGWRGRVGRYSIIGMQPGPRSWRCQDGRASVKTGMALSAPHAVSWPRARRTWTVYGSLIAETQLDVPAHLPPMAGGPGRPTWGYDMGGGRWREVAGEETAM